MSLHTLVRICVFAVGIAIGIFIERMISPGLTRDAIAIIALIVLAIIAFALVLMTGILLGVQTRATSQPDERVLSGVWNVAAEVTGIQAVQVAADANQAVSEGSPVTSPGARAPRLPLEVGLGKWRVTTRRDQVLAGERNGGDGPARTVTLRINSAWFTGGRTRFERIRAQLANRDVVLRLLLLCAVLALAAQWDFHPVELDLPPLSLLLFGLALLALFGVIVGVGKETPPEIPLDARTARPFGQFLTSAIRTALLVSSLGLAVLTLHLILIKSGDVSYLDAFVAWAVGCLAYLIAFMPYPIHWAWKSWLRTHWIEVLMVAALTLFAGVLRFYALGQIPDTINGDEGQIGLLGQSYAGGVFVNVFSTSYGHSSMYLLIIGWLVELFGNNAFGLRITSALSGTLTIPALYVLARVMFDRRTAILSAALLTVSHFHLHFSRVVTTGSIQDVFFATIVFLFLYLGLKKSNSIYFVLSGLTLGFYLTIYMGARLLIPLVPVYFIVLALFQWKAVRANVQNLIAFAGALAVSSAPMALYALRYPEDFNARWNQIGILRSGWLEQQIQTTGEPWFSILARLVRDSFLTVNYYGADAFYFTSVPMLDDLAAAFFFIGIAYSLFHLRDQRYLLLNAWFWSAVLGNALVISPEKAAYRILIVFPAVVIFAAIGLAKLLELAIRATKPATFSPALVNACVVVWILGMSFLNLKAYWVDWVPACKYHDAGTHLQSLMGSFLAAQPRDTQAFLVGAPMLIYGTHPSAMFLSGNMPVVNVEDVIANPDELGVKPNHPAVFLFTPPRLAEMQLVAQKFPNGDYSEIKECSGLTLSVYRTNPR